MITKTKIKKTLAGIAVSALIVAPFSYTFAAPSQIGTGSVTGSGAFNSAIMWDGNIPGTASGAISGVVVNATVTPMLNMALSAGIIDLGVLNSSTYSTGSLGLEIGTNAAGGVVVTAKSNSGGLTNLADPSVQINDLTADGIAESYKFASSLSGTLDSTVVGYTRTSSLSTEVNNTNSHTIYTTNKPEQTSGVDDIKFEVAAKVDAQTPGGSYKDTINFIVSGTF